MPKNPPNPAAIKNAAFKREILRLQKKVAKLEVENFSLKQALAIARKPTTAGLPQEVLERAQQFAREQATKQMTDAELERIARGGRNAV